MTENRRNRLLLAEAELRDATGTVLATATGKYVPIPAEVVAPMLSDFLSDPRTVLAELAGQQQQAD